MRSQPLFNFPESTGHFFLFFVWMLILFQFVIYPAPVWASHGNVDKKGVQPEISYLEENAEEDSDDNKEDNSVALRGQRYILTEDQKTDLEKLQRHLRKLRDKFVLLNKTPHDSSEATDSTEPDDGSGNDLTEQADEEVKRDHLFFNTMSRTLNQTLARIEHTLKGRLDPDAVLGQDGPVLMHFAATFGSAKVVSDLLKFGASATQEYKKIKPLCQAVANVMGCIKVVEVLLENGARVDRACAKGRIFPLFVASHMGHTLIVKLLLSHEAPMDRGDGKHTPLVAALAREHFQTAKILRENGADSYKDSHPFDPNKPTYPAKPIPIPFHNHPESYEHLKNSVKSNEEEDK